MTLSARCVCVFFTSVDEREGRRGLDSAPSRTEVDFSIVRFMEGRPYFFQSFSIRSRRHFPRLGYWVGGPYNPSLS